MNILVASLENNVLGEQTSFDSEKAAGQTELTVKNSQGFSIDDYIILGTIGSETAEVRKISSTTATTITISVATSFLHEKNDPIQLLRFNQRKFYRSTTEDGTYTELISEGSPVDIEVDKPEGTEFEDSTGTSTSFYKVTYYNSTSSLESAIADSIASKASDSNHYTSIYKIKDEAGFKDNSYIGSDVIDRYRTEAESIAESTIAIVYQVPLASTPRIFQHIVTLLSAGFLLSKEYGLTDDTDVSKTGQRKIERAEELLKKITDGEILLLSASNAELSRQTTNLASCSNVYDSTKTNKGSLFTTEDELFKMADPSSGQGSTAK